MEFTAVIGIMCIVPLLLVAFGYWLGRGSPGWPWALVRRDGENVYTNGRQTSYFDER